MLWSLQHIEIKIKTKTQKKTNEFVRNNLSCKWYINIFVFEALTSERSELSLLDSNRKRINERTEEKPKKCAREKETNHTDSEMSQIELIASLIIMNHCIHTMFHLLTNLQTLHLNCSFFYVAVDVLFFRCLCGPNQISISITLNFVCKQSNIVHLTSAPLRSSVNRLWSGPFFSDVFFYLSGLTYWLSKHT